MGGTTKKTKKKRKEKKNTKKRGITDMLRKERKWNRIK